MSTHESARTYPSSSLPLTSAAMTARIAVLASGGGSNLQAIIDHLAALGEAAPARVVLVASDRASAGALDRAGRHEIERIALSASQRGDDLEALLAERDVDLIALAGYLRHVPPRVTRRWRGRIVNVHPALLPAFGGTGMYGSRVHDAVVRAGARVSGATVHFVDEEYDRGPIIAQWPVPVLPTDDAVSLGERVLRIEHLLYPRALAALAAGRVRLGDDGRVVSHAAVRDAARFTLTDRDAVTEALDAMLA